MRTVDTMIKNYDGHITTRSDVQLRDIKKQLPLRVLSEEDWAHWTSQGFVIVKNVISRERASDLVDVLWEFNEASPDSPDTWNRPERRPHRSPEFNNVGMLEIYHHQLMWDNRQNSRIYDAFVDIWDRTDLWVLLDRANLSTPKPGDVAKNGFVHWDVDTSKQPLPISVQGTLSLTDQSPETGGFQCVPGIFNDLETWIASQPSNRHPLHPDPTGHEIVTLELSAGDLVIWNSLLPHAIKPNQSKDQFRAAQYLSMVPANYNDEAMRVDRIETWKNLRKPAAGCFPGDPRDWEKKHYGPASLTELGEKLLGMKHW
ncbi:MAG: phytanoyl-CoA dioxygenase family protein [Granulosicoccus sp.]